MKEKIMKEKIMKEKIIEIFEQIKKENYDKQLCFPLIYKFKEMLMKYGIEFEKCFINIKGYKEENDKVCKMIYENDDWEKYKKNKKMKK